MTIKNIVISGGGPSALLCYGIIKYLTDVKYFNIEDIECYYGTSSGAILSVILIMGFEYETLDDYFLKRQWNKVFDLKQNNNYDLINYLTDKGIDGKEFIIKLFEPLMTSKNIDINITLLEFYNLTKKKLFIYGSELNNSNKIDTIEISYETFPEMRLIDALTITTSIPFVFKPIIYKNMCFVDGGLLNNFPLNNCLERNNKEEIFGMGNYIIKPSEKITETTDFMDYIAIIIQKTYNTLKKQHNKIENLINYDITDIRSIDSWVNYLIDNNKKIELIEKGEEYAKKYLKSLNYDNVDSQNSIKLSN